MTIITDTPSEDGSIKSQAKSNITAMESYVEKKHKPKPVKWSPENEEILVEWCDIAKIYKWLNSRTNTKLSRQHAMFTIPTITLSTITGTASFAQASLPVSFQRYSPSIIGAINIFIGILSTIQQYLKISELNEAHRVSAIAWDKFARNIKIELSKDPSERTDAGQFTKLCRMEYDRLMETSPTISQSIINAFNDNFRGKEGSEKRQRYDDLRKPDICNTIITADKYRHKWYKNIEKEFNDDDDIDDIEMQRGVTYSIKERFEDDESKIDELMKLKEEKEADLIKQKQLDQMKDQETKMRDEVIKQEIEIIQKYIVDFIDNAGRKPLLDEIETNMKDKISDNAFAIYSKDLDHDD